MTDEFMPPPDSAITPEEWQQTPARVQRWIREVWSENQQLETRWSNCGNSPNGTHRILRNRPHKIGPTRNPRENRQAHRVNGEDNLVTPAIIGCWWKRLTK